MSFYANGRVSKPIRTYLDPFTYEVVMDCLRHIETHQEEYSRYPIAAKAGHLADMIAKYAYMSPEMTDDFMSSADDDGIEVRISLFPSEMVMFDWLLGFLVSTGYHWGSWVYEPGDGYMLELVDKLDAYEKQREIERQQRLAMKEAERKAREQARAAKQSAKLAKENALRERIISYIKQCEHDGIRPSRQAMVDDEHSRYMVDKIWATIN